MAYATMTLAEIALGLALEHDPAHPRFELVPDPTPPRAALESVLLALLQRGRVSVAFSGGIDSSGLLCLTADVARRHGLPDPVPVTSRFPHAPETDESEWQELVIRHLDLTDWVRVDVGEDAELLGPPATRALLRHGVRWPALLHMQEVTMAAVPGTIHVMGNGGDELTFPTRAGTLQLLRDGRLVRDRAAAAAILHDLRPQLQRFRPGADARVPHWVRPDARRLVASLLRNHPHTEGFRWRAELERRTNAPWALRGHANVVEQGAELGVEIVQPLTSPAVIASMLSAAGRWGPTDRSEGALLLYGDTMPAAVRGRRDKVNFVNVVIGEATREFIRTWDGHGLPDELVDPSLVRAEWDKPQPRYSSFALLQHAWLQQQRR